MDARPLFHARRAVLVLAAVGGVLVAPLAVNAVHLIVNGDYVTQQNFWRSAPDGIDLLTLALGNPFHGLWGASVRG